MSGSRGRSRPDDGPGEERDGENDADDGLAEDAAVEIPITGELDLHAFAPRDVPSVVEEYLAACQERNIRALRIVHGKGKGVQRAVVHRVLRSSALVASFGDAPAERGGFGATLVTLVACDSSHDTL
jgi:DNA-nicking Smr family endonuclease